jgi:hypothetical protein
MANLTPEKFLTELKAHNTEFYHIVTTIRDLILKDPNTTEEIKYGGLLYSRKQPYTGLFVYKNHVTQEFSNGNELNDPAGHLTGSGKYRRHLTLKTVDDVDETYINDLLKQAATIAS